MRQTESPEESKGKRDSKQACMHPSLSVDRSIVRESPKLLKESGRQKKEGKGRQGPLLCVVLCCASLASSSASNPLETANQKKKVKKKKEEGKKLVFFFCFSGSFLFLVMGSSWAKYPVPFAFWIYLFSCELWLFGSVSNSSSSFS